MNYYDHKTNLILDASHIIEKKHDKKGNHVSTKIYNLSKTIIIVKEYSVEYDNKGNWVKVKEKSVEGGKETITFRKREIEYY